MSGIRLRAGQRGDGGLRALSSGQELLTQSLRHTEHASVRLSAVTTIPKGVPPGTASVADESLQAPGLAASESRLTWMLLTFS